MKFGLIDPHRRTVGILEVRDIEEAMRIAGLKLGEVDHATVSNNLAIVVDQWSLMTPPSGQAYFSLAAGGGRHLFGGNAVLYGYDQRGETINVDDTQPLHVTWMGSAEAVEDAIKQGYIERPAIRVNGVVMWEWTATPASKSKMN